MTGLIAQAAPEVPIVADHRMDLVVDQQSAAYLDVTLVMTGTVPVEEPAVAAVADAAAVVADAVVIVAAAVVAVVAAVAGPGPAG